MQSGQHVLPVASETAATAVGNMLPMPHLLVAIINLYALRSCR